MGGEPPEEILIDNITPGEPGEEVAWLDSGLTARTEYTYEVWAVDGAGNEGIPAEVKATTTAGQDPVPPTPPRNLSVFLSGFSVTLTWEPASDNIGVAGYKVYRWVKEDGPSAAVVTVIEDPDAISFSEPDVLDASTTYVYAVVAYDAAGNESILEGEDPEGIPAAVVEITTRALMITTFQWSAPRVECGLLDPGNPLDDERPAVSVTVVGDASRSAKATVVFAGVYVNLLDEDPDNDGIYEVDLVEDTSNEGVGLGIYRGSIPIPRGTTRLVSITYQLSDNRGHSVEAKARGVPEEFAGIVEVEVSSDYPDADALKDAEIKLWSESLGTGIKVTVNGTGTYFLSGLPPATDYELTLKSKKNEVLAEWPDISVGSGLTSRVVVDAAIPATFDIYVVKKDGQPAGGVTVTVTRENGGLLAQGMTSGQTGLASLRYSDNTLLTTGTAIVVSLVLPSYFAIEYTGIAGKRIVLGPGTNSITIELPTRGRASLYGKAKSAQTQTPLTEATITAYQVIEGRETLIEWTRTGSSGDYSLNLYEGPVRLVITHSTLGISEEIRLDNPLEPGENRSATSASRYRKPSLSS
ncbi:MAG TPA: fibronectin type III domain-containing protein [Firmicutes bacterium]|nr:fibronectin type III domain-containing protein [Candidatus Fermentithermobacillaceae bacterium]